jgi:hypothetical protein
LSIQSFKALRKETSCFSSFIKKEGFAMLNSLKLFGVKHACFLAFLSLLGFSVLAESYDLPKIKYRDLPGPLQMAYKNEKPNLGEIGRCAVNFEDMKDESKMVFTCSIYVKMSAVAERKAMERCEQLSGAKKSGCKIIQD